MGIIRRAEIKKKYLQIIEKQENYVLKQKKGEKKEKTGQNEKEEKGQIEIKIWVKNLEENLNI